MRKAGFIIYLLISTNLVFNIYQYLISTKKEQYKALLVIDLLEVLIFCN